MSKVDLCKTGRLQAPINIKTDKTKRCEGNCQLNFYYRSSICSIANNSGNLIMEYDAGSYVNYNDLIYELDKISFTVPASNKIDGSSYQMEMLLWHKSMDIGKVLIVSVFIDVNDATSRSKQFFDILANTLPKKSGNENLYNTPEDWNVYDALPENKAFYLYSGSLPQSPCSENVTWVVMDSAVNISQTVYQNIKNIIGKNSRQIQKTHSRTIYYNPNNDIKNNRNYGSKLRCYTDTELRRKCKCMCKDGKTVDIFPSINKKWLLILLIILFIGLFIYVAIQIGLFNGVFTKFKDYIQSKPTVLKVTAE